MNNLERLIITFYKTFRSPIYMSDQGGPFGFDIHHALEVDYAINSYQCDAIIETGTFLGDTTQYLSEMYPHLPIITVESNQDFFKSAEQRLKNCKNVTLLNGSSHLVIKDISKKYKRPFFYLDAHWYEPNSFPLKNELKNIKTGIVCIGDFFIGNNNAQQHFFISSPTPAAIAITYCFDVYDDVFNDKHYIDKYITRSTELYVNNITDINVYPVPCHQWNRRAGRGYFAVGIKEDHFKDCNFFKIPTYDLSY